MIDKILSPEYAEQIREAINEERTQPLEYYEPMFEPQTGLLNDIGISSVAHFTSSLRFSDHGTSHCSVVDADGNAVAVTSTINTE